MIEFKWNKIDRKNNTPVIKDVDLDELAEMLIKDYKPAILKAPRKIKYEHFLESYLGANLEYQHIYYGENEGPVFGVTAFNKERLKVFDKENLCTKNVTLDKNSIVLDYYVTEEGREGLELFTGLHEGGHLWLHPKVYAEPEGQISLFAREIKPVTCCRRSDIESFGRVWSGNRTPEQWREHQADYFASAIAMPKSTFIPLIQETLKANGITDGYVLEDLGLKEQIFAQNELPEVVMNVYGVSRQAAYVKLKKFGFIKNKKNIEKENSQFTLF